MIDRTLTLAALRQKLATVTADPTVRPAEMFALGHEEIDGVLGGGLARARLHEIHAGAEADAASATGFALMLALRACPPGTPIFWVRQEAGARRLGPVYPPGLVELGANPDHIVFVLAPDEKAVLRAAADILRCPGVGAALIEPWGKAPLLDLTASRRLALAAEKSGVTALLLRGPAAPAPSAATSRWEVRAAPSTLLEMDSPGAPAFEVELLRHRSGLSGLRWRMEWDRDRLSFRKPPLSGAVVPLPAGGHLGASECRYA
jgi:protein ImuA